MKNNNKRILEENAESEAVKWGVFALEDSIKSQKTRLKFISPLKIY